jgi:hypothetical protein
MNRRLLLWSTGIIATLIAPFAAAQEVTIGYQGLPYKASGESNTGIQLSDGLLLHSGIGAEAGYDTNVFYETSDAARGSAIIRVMPYLEATNADRLGPVSHQFSYDVRAALLYRRYQSDDPAIKPYANAWMPNGGFSLSYGGGQLGFGIAETIARIEDTPYLASSGNPIVRDNNQFSIEGRWSPGGGRLTGTLRYTNMIDYFENLPYSAYADSITNLFMLDGAWRWLPKTAIFANVQQGYISYFNNSNKASSLPLRAVVGLRGLLTTKTSAILSVGYTNGFYTSGASTSGFWGSTYAELAFTVQPTLVSRFVAGYRHDFQNSVIASFAYNDTVYLSYLHQIAGRLALSLSGRYAHLRYGGELVDMAQQGRIDDQFQVGASLDYFLRNWMYVGVAYSLVANNSSGFTMATAPQVDYLKQQVFVRLGVTY